VKLTLQASRSVKAVAEKLGVTDSMLYRVAADLRAAAVGKQPGAPLAGVARARRQCKCGQSRFDLPPQLPFHLIYFPVRETKP
jgi:hypothetical protein